MMPQILLAILCCMDTFARWFLIAGRSRVKCRVELARLQGELGERILRSVVCACLQKQLRCMSGLSDFLGLGFGLSECLSGALQLVLLLRVPRIGAVKECVPPAQRPRVRS